MRALGRASMDTDGLSLADSATDEVLGVHMIGARAPIYEAVTAMEFRASAEDIARMSHSHPVCGGHKRSCSCSFRIVLFIYNFNFTEHVEVNEF